MAVVFYEKKFAVTIDQLNEFHWHVGQYWLLQYYLLPHLVVVVVEMLVVVVDCGAAPAAAAVGYAAVVPAMILISISILIPVALMM